MITMTLEMNTKIELLDKLFGAMSLDQLKEFTESEQIVSRLRGDGTNPQILKSLISDSEARYMDSVNLRAEIGVLRSDLQSVITAMSKPHDQHAINQFNSIKSKYGVY